MKYVSHKIKTRLLWLLVGGLTGLNAGAAELALPDTPLFVSAVNEPPLILLTMGRDHKLFYEAYNDASDLNDDGQLDVNYDTSIDYFGYFDSKKCYVYDSSDGRFEPSTVTADKTCSGATEWSGDFLNYVTMARMDAIRGVLYGGYRSVDTATTTVLERTFIPQDAHSWAKEYTSIAVDGFDIRDYTPLDLPATEGVYHLLGNTTLLNSAGQEPRLRVLENTIFRASEWASIERPVVGDRCLNGGNGPLCTSLTGGATQFLLVPDNATASSTEVSLSGLTRTVYDTDGNGASCTATERGDDVDDVDTVEDCVKAASSDTGTDNPSVIDADNAEANSLGQSDHYYTEITGTIHIPSDGTYDFAVNGDDAIDFYIDVNSNGYIDGTVGTNERFASFYTPHGFNNVNNITNSNLIPGTATLTAGTYPIRLRHIEIGGGSGYELYYRRNIGTPATPARTDYNVRVQVCVSGLLEANCKRYPNNNSKPTGILHDFGENDRMKFGLLTGSYAKNLSGGVLRKKMGTIRNEIDPTNGVLTSTVGIIKTIDRLRITNFGGNFVHDCGFIFTRAPNEGECRSWGNPVSEMMYEGLRYFAGKATPTSDYMIPATGNDDASLGLPLATWDDPYNVSTGANECAKPMQLVISDINPSYDTDKLPGVDSNFGSFTGDVSGLNVKTIADSTISPNETDFADGDDHFIGQVGATFDGAPTAKTITSMGNIRGLAPEEPTKQGGYYSSSIGYFGKTTDVNPRAATQNVTTLAVAIASPLPKFEIPVAGNTITLVPFAKSTAGGGITTAQGNFHPTNTITDFYIEEIANTHAGNADATVNGGLPFYKFQINFEDAEQGADHDMDAISEYIVTVDDGTLIGDDSDDTLTVRMDSIYAAGGIIQHMGYIISGTDSDGIYLDVRDSDTNTGNDVDYFLDTPNVSGALPLSQTRTFTPGLVGGATLLEDPLWYAAKWGGFEDENDNNMPDLTSEWDADSDGIPDNYFLVTNAGKLSEQLEDVFNRITELVGASASSVAINSTVLQTTSRLYQAKFSTAEWTGELSAFEIGNMGEIDSTMPVWQASQNIPAAASRNIFTFGEKTVGMVTTTEGIPFDPSDSVLADVVGDGAVTPANKVNDNSGIGAAFMSYIRGNTANEIQNGGVFRDRPLLPAPLPGEPHTAGDPHLLSDIVNASPISVGNSNFAYDVLPGDEGSSYLSYLAQKATTYSDVFGADSGNSFTVVITGANDGMIHAFQDTVDVDDDNPSSKADNPGKEIFAYIPSVLQERLHELVDPNYEHKFYVDASPFAADAYFDDGDNSTNDWRTIVVGALGNGGKTIYALDISDPLNFSAADVMWEYTVTDPTGVDSSDNSEEMGNIYNQPQVVRLNNGKWGVVFGNGYNSASQTARLFILDAETGAEIAVIDTEVGDTSTPNGLAMPFLLDEDGDRNVDTVYAGDLYGNMWKFDLTSNNPSQWGFTNNFKQGSTPKPLYQTEDIAGNPQAITTKPVVVSQTTPGLGGFIVLFGSGKYIEVGDNIIPASPQLQSFYGIWDNDAQVKPGAGEDRDDILQVQSVLAEIDIPGPGPDGILGNADDEVLNTTRVNTDTVVSYPSKKGWYIDLKKPSPALADGEMVISNPITRFGRIIWTSFIPPQDPCGDEGGSAVLMELDAVSGARLENSVFDLNNDGTIDAGDFVTYNGSDVPGSGIYIPATLASPAVISADDASTEYKLTSGISGTVTTTQESTGGTTVGRQSWRQLR